MSLIVPGHVLALKLSYANGTPCQSKRPFLVIEKKGDILELINVSSTKGKERKLLFDSNEKIKKYSPPLDGPSFIKMDELYTIDYFSELKYSIYKRRPPLDSIEFSRLKYLYEEYKKKNEILHVNFLETTVREYNFS